MAESIEAAGRPGRNAPEMKEPAAGRALSEDTRQGTDSASVPRFSQDALALVFAERAALFLRWSPETGWMARDGQRWDRDSSMRRWELARLVCREAAARCGNAADSRRIASASTVRAVLSMAQHDPRIIIAAGAADAGRIALRGGRP